MGIKLQAGACCARQSWLFQDENNMLALLLLSLLLSTASSCISRPRTDDVFDRSEECLHYHNIVRRNHQAGDLKIDKSLVSYAKLTAYQLYHNPDYSLADKPYGINAHFGPHLANSDCQRIVEFWYNQVEFYDFRRPVYQEETKFFTQLVWEESTKLGCASSLDTFNPSLGNKTTIGHFTVCVYAPKGNIEGKFADNVWPRAD